MEAFSESYLWGNDPWELFLRGGSVMWPLLAGLVLALAVACERLLHFWWSSYSLNRLLTRLELLVRRGESGEALAWLAGLGSPLARVAAAAIERAQLPVEQRQEIVARVASEETARLEQRLGWLATIGHLSPMLGLLGTILGLITAFHEIELQGGQVQPVDLANGIWEALLTTVFGLLIALPTLGMYAMLDQWVGTKVLQMQWVSSYLEEWFQETPGFGEVGASPADDSEKPNGPRKATEAAMASGG